MNVLITSGGTKVPIDSVRDITNMSQGTFGAKIATEFLKSQCPKPSVRFIRAQGSKSPFEFRYDLYKGGFTKGLAKLAQMADFYESNVFRYSEHTYRNFVDYESVLWNCMEDKPDIVILAAAVSDYGVAPIEGKIRSGDAMSLQLFPYQKLISQVKERYPNVFLVGFKLLVNSTEEALESAILKSMEENKCDMVVGNDLRDIKSSDHRLLLANRSEFVPGRIDVSRYFSNPNDDNFLARSLVDLIRYYYTKKVAV